MGPKGDKGIRGDPGPQVSPDNIIIIIRPICKSLLFFLESCCDIFQGKPGKDGVPGELGEQVACLVMGSSIKGAVMSKLSDVSVCRVNPELGASWVLQGSKALR